jgi:hypothetical protein
MDLWKTSAGADDHEPEGTGSGETQRTWEGSLGTEPGAEARRETNATGPGSR